MWSSTEFACIKRNCTPKVQIPKSFATEIVIILSTLTVIISGCDYLKNMPQRDKDSKWMQSVAETVMSPSYEYIWQEQFDYICEYSFLSGRRISISPFSITYFGNDTAKVDLDLLLFNEAGRHRQHATLNLMRGQDSLLVLSSLSLGPLRSTSPWKDFGFLLGIFLIGSICSFVAISAMNSEYMSSNIFGFIVAIIGGVSLLAVVPSFAYFYWQGSYGMATLAMILGLVFGGGRLLLFWLKSVLEGTDVLQNLILLAIVVVGIYTSFTDLSKAYEQVEVPSNFEIVRQE